MTTQSIIVYRNPIEAHFWESGMMFPLLVSLGIFAAVLIVLCKLFEKKMRFNKNSNFFLAVFCAVSAVPAILAFNYLNI